jgi:uncharacterized protein (UPF0332 family)
MAPGDYIALATRLAAGPTEAEWRTAVSRAYYAAFHAARQLLSDLGFTIPRAESAHQYLILRLSNCGEPPIRTAAADLDHLRRLRNRADYDWHRPFGQPLARPQAATAQQIIQALDAARTDPIRTQITDAMKVYERDVLHDVTWHP